MTALFTYWRFDWFDWPYLSLKDVVTALFVSPVNLRYLAQNEMDFGPVATRRFVYTLQLSKCQQRKFSWSFKMLSTGTFPVESCCSWHHASCSDLFISTIVVNNACMYVRLKTACTITRKEPKTMKTSSPLEDPFLFVGACEMTWWYRIGQCEDDSQ